MLTFLVDFAKMAIFIILKGWLFGNLLAVFKLNLPIYCKTKLRTESIGSIIRTSPHELGPKVIKSNDCLSEINVKLEKKNILINISKNGSYFSLYFTECRFEWLKMPFFYRTISRIKSGQNGWRNGPLSEERWNRFPMGHISKSFIHYFLE